MSLTILSKVTDDPLSLVGLQLTFNTHQISFLHPSIGNQVQVKRNESMVFIFYHIFFYRNKSYNKLDRDWVVITVTFIYIYEKKFSETMHQ